MAVSASLSLVVWRRCPCLATFLAFFGGVGVAIVGSFVVICGIGVGAGCWSTRRLICRWYIT